MAQPAGLSWGSWLQSSALPSVPSAGFWILSSTMKRTGLLSRWLQTTFLHSGGLWDIVGGFPEESTPIPHHSPGVHPTRVSLELLSNWGREHPATRVSIFAVPLLPALLTPYPPLYSHHWLLTLLHHQAWHLAWIRALGHAACSNRNHHQNNGTSLLTPGM